MLALLGLLVSLFIRPRRVWVRARVADGRGQTLVEVGGLDRTDGGDPARVAADLAGIVGAELGGTADGHAGGGADA